MIFDFLKQNDIVDVVFPGTSSIFSEIEKIKVFLEKSNFVPRIFLERELTLKKTISHEFSSFDASKRFEQLKNAIEAPDSKIIWCARGGYGSAELLPFLTKLKKPKKEKIFIGFSDISSFNKLLIEEWGWKIVSAPVLAQIVLNKVSKKSEKVILNFILGKLSELKYELKSLTKLTTYDIRSTTIVGGCISVIASHFGTKNQINWKDKILFLEDEGESGERLDRYFSHMINIMIENKSYPKAILLGNFLQANPHGTPKAKNIKIAIERFIKKLAENKINFSVFEEKSKCLGHSKNMRPLVLGAEADITVDGFLVQKTI